jgi:hypothetical protein
VSTGVVRGELVGYAAHWGLVGKLGGKRSFWRPNRRWDNNLKMDLD